METFKAQPIGDQVIPDLHIVAKLPMPEIDCKKHDSVYTQEANKIVDALFSSLPGGVLDRILAEMMRRKASMLVVTFPQTKGE